LGMNGFGKRIFSWAGFRESVGELFEHAGEMRSAVRSGRVDRSFAEKIMLVVTQVNGCRYCRYGHTRAALAAGVSPDELKRILGGELAEFPAEEATALVFAQHYAETNGEIDPAAWECLVDYYGEATASDILVYIRMITFGNLLGNTYDALLSRLAGRPAPGSRMLEEVGVLLGTLVLLPVVMVVAVLGGVR
jgi:AhpD family alkylhydroperoxidase